MSDKIRQSYKQSRNIYDDVLTRNTWWSRLYMNIFWGGCDDNEIARRVLDYIPNDFKGDLLDVPVGTGIFTCEKYGRMKDARIMCVDYSQDMLDQAERRFKEGGLHHVKTMQGDVGALPFRDRQFDVVLSMNGFHVFPDKERAYSEVHRVLKPGGLFIACYYVRGESRISDWLVNTVLSRKGWFTPPFETSEQLRRRLEDHYSIEEFHLDGSMVYFKAVSLI
jgi:ubiquinone/menaquinone biosynthesis C-methylase UbiE